MRSQKATPVAAPDGETAPREQTGPQIAQSILPFFGKPPFYTPPRPPGSGPARGPATGGPKGAPVEEPQYKVPIPRQSGKEGAKDTPGWAKGTRPRVGETGEQAAKRAMDGKYGEGNWDRKTGDGEFGKLQKYYDRHFRDPKELPSPYEGPFAPGDDRVASRAPEIDDIQS